MSAFTSEDQARKVFVDLFEILVADPEFTTKMAAAGLSLELIHTKPEVTVFADATGVGTEPRATPANVRIKMSCDTAHKLWSGDLLMPVALATGRVRIKGPVNKVLELVPILEPAFSQYADVAARHGVAA